MVPVKMQPLEELRRRFPEAVAEPFDVESVVLGVVQQPGLTPRCIFDFEDGLRLIVSKEIGVDGVRRLHFSSSVIQPSALYKCMIRLTHQNPIGYLVRITEERYAELSGDTRTPVFSGVTVNGVPHWCIE